MGSYFICPACKAANGPCKALNCDEVIAAMGRQYGKRSKEPIPALIYPPRLWQRTKWVSKRLLVWIAQQIRRKVGS